MRGDVLRVRPGDQIVVDGPLLDARAAGSRPTSRCSPASPTRSLKHPGDELRSGSLCVAGGGRQLARDVGAASYAGRLTAQARRATTDKTPLQRRIEFVVRLVMALTVLMSGAILAQAALEGFTLLRVVQTTAVLSGLVPYGLFFLIAVAYTAGAATLAGRGALVQQVNAVESVSNVDVVCTDKTGTLTTGRLTLGRDPAARRAAARRGRGRRSGRWPAAPARPTSPPPRWPRACPGAAWTVRDEVPFASALRWSGVTTDEGSWVLGAPDALAPHLAEPLPGARWPSGPGAGCGCCCWPAPPTSGRRAARRRRPPGAALAGAGRAGRAGRRAAPRGHREHQPVPRRRGRAQGPVRRRPAHRRRARHPGRPGRRRAGVGRRAGRPRRRGPGPAGRAQHRVRPGRPRAEGADRRVAAPPGPLRRDDRRRGQRRPRAQGRAGRGGHAQRQRGHPRRRRHRARRRLLRRAAARPSARAGASSTASPCRCTCSWPGWPPRAW